MRAGENSNSSNKKYREKKKKSLALLSPSTKNFQMNKKNEETIKHLIIATNITLGKSICHKVRQTNIPRAFFFIL
jgi:hypothetical protein